MSEESYREKLQSLGFSRRKGTTRKREITNELTGGYGGYHLDHWDGRVDATVVASPAVVNPDLRAREVE